MSTPVAPEPDYEDPKEVRAFFGLAFYIAQVCEQGVVNLAVALHGRIVRHVDCSTRRRSRQAGARASTSKTLDGPVVKRHANPPPETRGLVHLRRVAKDAFPGCSIRFFSHGTLGGHRAPTINTLAFRLIDARGRFRSNVIWVAPQHLRGWTAEDVRRAVDDSNGE